MNVGRVPVIRSLQLLDGRQYYMLTFQEGFPLHMGWKSARGQDRNKREEENQENNMEI